jgi:hypothetical protein
MSARRVVVVDADDEQQARVAQALRPLALEVVLHGALGDLPAYDDYDLLIVNYDSVAGDRATLVHDLSALRGRAPLLVLSAGRCREDFVELFGNHALTNLLARDAHTDERELIVTTEKILRREVFGIERYFVPGVEAVSTTAVGSADKGRILDEAEAYAKRLGIRPRFVELFCAVTDELVTNALFNAPVDADGRRRYAHLSRADDVVLAGGERVEVRLCCDGRRLGVAAIDPFGSITQERVLDYLAKCFRKGADQMDRKQGGAGLGLYYAFESLSHFVVNICPGRRTEMIGLIDIHGSYRDFVGKSKSFNMFVSD